jgi:transposase
MTNSIKKGQVKVLGIDIAKQSFQLHGVDEGGHVVLKKKLTRVKLTATIANLPPCVIGMEACGGAHHWYRVFTEMGHTVHLIAAQFVKPFVKSNKNDLFLIRW